MLTSSLAADQSSVSIGLNKKRVQWIDSCWWIEREARKIQDKTDNYGNELKQIFKWSFDVFNRNLLISDKGADIISFVLVVNG